MTTVKIDDIVRIYKGKKVEALSDRNDSNALRYIQIDDLRNENNLKYTTEDGVHVSQKDVVIAWDGANAGTVGYGISGIIGSTLAKLELKTSDILPEYLGLFLKSKSQHLRDKSTGATIPHISKYVLSNLQIKVLPLDEQNQIVSEITQVSKLREKRKQVIELMDEYLKSVFMEMFGDPVENQKVLGIIKFGEIVDDIRYGSSRKSTNEASDKTVPILRIPNILHGKINYKDLQYQDLPSNEKQKLLLKKGDILFVRSNGNPDYIGRCAVFHDTEDCIYASYLIRVRLKNNSEFRPDFVRYVFSVDSYKQKIRKESRTTAGNYNINTQGIKNFDLIKPSLMLQDKFLSLFNEVETLKVKMNDQAKELDNQFQALMQKSFSLN